MSMLGKQQLGESECECKHDKIKNIPISKCYIHVRVFLNHYIPPFIWSFIISYLWCNFFRSAFTTSSQTFLGPYLSQVPLTWSTWFFLVLHKFFYIYISIPVQTSLLCTTADSSNSHFFLSAHLYFTNNSIPIKLCLPCFFLVLCTHYSPHC